MYNLVNNKQEKGNCSICHLGMWTNAGTGIKKKVLKSEKTVREKTFFKMQKYPDKVKKTL